MGLLIFPLGDSITMCWCGWGRVINEPSDFIVSLDDESEENKLHSCLFLSSDDFKYEAFV